MLKIKNLYAQTEKREILKGIFLDINPGELHVIMGPNGAGKSTLSSVLTGKADFTVSSGKIEFNGEDITDISPDQRSLKGMFLGFQQPVEIPGVSTAQFLREMVNAHRKASGEDPIDAMDFLQMAKDKAKELNIDESFLTRSFNEGFSGGEKKRNELLQLSLLNPKLIILDEIDSGLDLDGLKQVADILKKLQTKDNAFLLISHNPALVNVLDADKIHLLKDGVITKSGGKELVSQLEEEGYAG